MTKSEQTQAKPTVIYDGECAFCIARVDEIKRMDSEHRLDYLPRQDASSLQRFPQIESIALDDGILFVQPNGQVRVAMDAMYEIGKRLPAWRSLTWLYHLPVIKQVLQLGYRLVAMNRRRLGRVCSNNSCNSK